MTLQNLPPEIVFLIVQVLHTQGDLLGLVLSCRRFYKLLLPTLYSNATLLENTVKGKVQTQHTCAFLHAIVHNPALSHGVREIYLHVWESLPEQYPRLLQPDPELEYDAELLSQLLQEATQSEEERQEWERDAKAGIPDAWLGLLFLRLKNLRRVDIIFPSDTEYITRIFEKAASGTIRAFPHLEEAYLAYYDTLGGLSWHLMPFFHFPSMRKLGGSKVFERPLSPGEFPILPTSWSGITEVELEYSASLAGMIALMRSCRELKSFRISPGDDDFSPQLVLQCLAGHRATLERIWIDIDVELFEESWVGFFADFTKLKFLHVRLRNFLDIGDHVSGPKLGLRDLLPTSLETLYIPAYDEGILHHLIEQIRGLIKPPRTTKLAKLDLEYHALKPYQNIGPVLKELRDVCEKAGISFNSWDLCDKKTSKHRDSIWPSEFKFYHVG